MMCCCWRDISGEVQPGVQEARAGAFRSGAGTTAALSLARERAQLQNTMERAVILTDGLSITADGCSFPPLSQIRIGCRGKVAGAIQLGRKFGRSDGAGGESYRARAAGEHSARMQVEQDASVGETGSVAEDSAGEIAQRRPGRMRQKLRRIRCELPYQLHPRRFLRQCPFLRHEGRCGVLPFASRTVMFYSVGRD